MQQAAVELYTGLRKISPQPPRARDREQELGRVEDVDWLRMCDFVEGFFYWSGEEGMLCLEYVILGGLRFEVKFLCPC